MNWGTLGFLLLVLACPIAMMLMMRGGHGHGGGGETMHHNVHDDSSLDSMSDEQLNELSDRITAQRQRRAGDAANQQGTRSR